MDSDSRGRGATLYRALRAAGGALDEALLLLTRELLERLQLRLLDAERGEDAREHEEGEDLEPIT